MYNNGKACYSSYKHSSCKLLLFKNLKLIFATYQKCAFSQSAIGKVGIIQFYTWMELQNDDAQTDIYGQSEEASSGTMAGSPIQFSAKATTIRN